MLAVKEILGVEPGGFTMIVVSLVVLALGVPVAARLGEANTGVFRRTGILYGGVLLVLLFGTFLIVRQVT